MTLTSEQIKKIANISKITLTEEEVEAYKKEMEVVIDFIHKIHEAEVPPNTDYMNLEKDGYSVHLRDDTVTDGNCIDSIMQNAPASSMGYFKVPKVIEEQ